jgi:hypothetical protein
VPVFFGCQREVVGSFGSQPVVASLELVEGFVEAAAEFGHDGPQRRDDPLSEDEFVDRGLVVHLDRVPGGAMAGKRVSAGAGCPCCPKDSSTGAFRATVRSFPQSGLNVVLGR